MLDCRYVCVHVIYVRLSVLLDMHVCGGLATTSGASGIVYRICETGFLTGTWGLLIQLGWLTVLPQRSICWGFWSLLPSIELIYTPLPSHLAF